MTDLTDAEQVMTAQKPEEELPMLTVGQFIKDMAQFPQDAPLLASLFGIGMTIPIFQAFLITTKDAGPLVVLQMSKEGTMRALQHGEQVKPEIT